MSKKYSAPPIMVIDAKKKYSATFKTDQGNFVIELFADKAPMTVNNFVFLARAGWFDDITFHVVKPRAPSDCWEYRGPGDFIPFVQTGDPSGTAPVMFRHLFRLAAASHVGVDTRKVATVALLGVVPHKNRLPERNPIGDSMGGAEMPSRPKIPRCGPLAAPL